MSSYATLKLGDYEIYSLRNDIDSFTAAIYHESDRRLRRVYYDHYYTEPLEDGDLVDCYEYAVSASIMKARLELMGFTLSKAQSLFESSIAEKIEYTEEPYLNVSGRLREATQYQQRLLRQLQREGFDGCITALRKILGNESPDFSSYEEPRNSFEENISEIVLNYKSYFDEEGLLLLTLAKAANPEMEFVLDITSIVYSGYYEAEETICQDILNKTLEEVRPYQKNSYSDRGKN